MTIGVKPLENGTLLLLSGMNQFNVGMKLDGFVEALDITTNQSRYVRDDDDVLFAPSALRGHQ